MAGKEPRLKVQSVTSDGEVTVCVEGPLTFRGVDRVRNALERAGSADRKVVLDLSHAALQDFAGAALVRDASTGARGLPRSEVLLPKASNRLLDAAARPVRRPSET